ncbi:MAG: hypothetical protein EP344_13825 [Bacteroidetes bacterium]|nr:MAG: hypothetical protein EP344_13825 [Bacteroidota bacterium]
MKQDPIYQVVLPAVLSLVLYVLLAAPGPPGVFAKWCADAAADVTEVCSPLDQTLDKGINKPELSYPGDIVSNFFQPLSSQQFMTFTGAGLQPYHTLYYPGHPTPPPRSL